MDDNFVLPFDTKVFVTQDGKSVRVGKITAIRTTSYPSYPSILEYRIDWDWPISNGKTEEWVKECSVFTNSEAAFDAMEPMIDDD